MVFGKVRSTLTACIDHLAFYQFCLDSFIFHLKLCFQN